MNIEDRKIQHGCTRKRKYTKNRAIFVATAARKRTEEDIQAYKCLYKRHWHVGHSNKNPGSGGTANHRLNFPAGLVDKAMKTIYQKPVDKQTR
jgi:hypothetical protein